MTTPYEEERMQEIVENLDEDQEKILQKFHADQSEGVLDDDLPDHYEHWLECLTLDELEDMLNLKPEHLPQKGKDEDEDRHEKE